MGGVVSKKQDNINTYDMFIAVLTILSLVNIPLYIIFNSESFLYVIATIDIFLSIIFFGDFLHRFFRAPVKRHYFFREFGWADLFASIPLPQFKILRLFRLIKTYKLSRDIGARQLLRTFFRERASSALYIVLLTIILLLQFGSIAILYAEQSNPQANITTSSDAIWWVYVTITTVGYGDHFPVTNLGRVLGMMVMFVGVGLFGVLTGFLANKFLASPEEVKTEDNELAMLRAEIAEIKALLEK